MTETSSQRKPILNIEDLTVAYRHGGRWLTAVREVSLSIRAGEIYGLVGESGSGKTTLVLAIMRYLGEGGTIQNGKVELAGEDVSQLHPTEMRKVWGKQVALVPQNPQSALNPSMRIGEQVVETLRQHQGLSVVEARQRTLESFEMVRMADPERVAKSFPHQISGGMKQRVMIAMALSTEPQLLILDEPTTSLDATTQAVILDLVGELIQGRRTAALYVTHNLGVVARVCNRVAVMYAGELVEEAATDALYHGPLHPYTRGLLDSVPRLGENKKKVQLRAISGQIPPLGERPSGCVFRERCPLAVEICLERPPLYTPEAGRATRCHRWEEILSDEASARQPLPLEPQVSASGRDDQPAVLNIEDLKVYYPQRRSIREWLRGETRREVRAVDGINLELSNGQTLGLVGESGSGKTSLARAITGLVDKTSGVIELLSVPLPSNLSERDLDTLRQLQMMFQNPEEALNPFMTVGESLRRPLITLLGMSGEEAKRAVAALLEAVQLPTSYAQRQPAQLSGGEKQRIAMARAFAANPDLLVADEPVSSLDVSVQATVLNLLHKMQVEHGSSLVFISHNLAVVGFLADKVAVIYLGNMMEVSDAEHLFNPPYHPYTEALLSAIPLIDPKAEQKRIRLEGEIPSPASDISGCPFHTRCPRFLGEVCIQETPPWRVDETSGKKIFCHIPVEQLRAEQGRVFTFSGNEVR